MTRKTSVIPGFKITLGITIAYLSIIILIPLSTIFFKTAGMGVKEFLAAAFDRRVLHAYGVSFFCAFTAALINVIFGVIIAWVIVRYEFPFKRLIDGMIDLPFALPTSVAGIALTTLFSENGWLGSILLKVGIKGSYTLLGITIALVFIGIPFVTRSVQPVLEELDKGVEEASLMLGASGFQKFRKVILPELLSPVLTGFSLAFARGIGEYGSVVFISGNKPMKTEIAPLLIMSKLEQFDYEGATAIAIVMLLVSFLMLLFMNLIRIKTNRFLKA
ncbi:sulfate ABC transporter permease subunit CysT [Anaerocolumna cellulosilytica]|uniref:Sulfate transport system permease protein CysT n=1 Tax=Anaerocolumna cellulosilytica TaxID=433286 RepID=A0A6S6R836_9FIRM|nr:sulfate ABC transporter permease subunit CysT [Anaerocolumna cellulosilytica]MBB5197172.1 sulfate transport system permease protein [Anaerocolumna cellulosilytica]BCJ95385.1 sulfate ABC transporter permease subunit CysT [Anaerocolumna cellulosilytica]